VLFDDAEIKARWQRYFSILLNGEAMEEVRSTEQEGSESYLDP